MNVQLLRIAAAAGTIAAASAASNAQPITIDMPDAAVASPSEFEVYFVSSEQGGRPDARDTTYDFSNTGVSEYGAVLLEASWAGNYPFQGPHITFEEGYWEGHLDLLRRHIERFVPDPNFTGLIVIDYESWRPLWERTKNKPSPGAASDVRDQDFKDDWRDFARVHYADRLAGKTIAQQELIFEETFEDAAREFFVRTIREVKDVRPSARVGYFMIPVKRYRHRETPDGVVGYGNLSYEASQLNDQLTWVAEESDFLMPNIYPPRYAMPEGVRASNPLGQTPDWRNAEYIYSSVREAVRMGNGKPVFVIGSTNYWGAHQSHPHYEAPLNEVNMSQQFEVARQAGASGLVLWHWKTTFPDSEFLPYLDATLAPIAAGYGVTADVDTETEVDETTGGGDTPQSGGGGGEFAEKDGDGGSDDPDMEGLTPEEWAAKQRERGEAEGKNGDDSADDGTTTVFTRTASTRTVTSTSKSAESSASGGTSGKKSKRTFTRKSSNSGQEDNNKQAGAPTEDGDSATKSDKKREAKKEEGKKTRTWVYKAPERSESDD